jgi:hypothetical protein
MFYKLFATITFVMISLWLTSKIIYFKHRIGGEQYNTTVLVTVVDRPLCGQSGVITVEYEGKTTDIIIGKNNCIYGKYVIGEKTQATYNTKFKEFYSGSYYSEFYACWALLLMTFFCYFVYMFLGDSTH